MPPPGSTNMNAVFLVVASVGLATPLQPSRPAASPAPAVAAPARTDCHGDPLPPDALQRLGTTRHRVCDHWWVELPDGGRLVVADPYIRRVDADTGRPLDALKLPDGCRTCGFSSDCRLVLAWDGKVLRLWDRVAGRELRTLDGVLDPKEIPFPRRHGWPDGGVYAHFSPDGRVIAATAVEFYQIRRVCAWDTDSGRLLWSESYKPGSPTRAPFGFLDDGQTLLMQGLTDGRVHLCDRATGRERRSFAAAMPRPDRPPPAVTVHRETLSRYVLSPDRRTVLAGDRGAVRVWDVATGKERPALGGHTGNVTELSFGPGGGVLLSGGDDPFVLVRDWPSGEVRRRIELGKGGWGLSVFAGGKRAAVQRAHETVLTPVDLETGKEMPGAPEGHRSQIYGIDITPDGRVVSAGCDDTFRVWDPRTGQQLHQHPIETSFRKDFALSGDGTYVAVRGTDEGTTTVYDRDTGRRRRTLPIDRNGIDRIAFAPGGRLLAAGYDSWD